MFNQNAKCHQITGRYTYSAEYSACNVIYYSAHGKHNEAKYLYANASFYWGCVAVSYLLSIEKHGKSMAKTWFWFTEANYRKLKRFNWQNERITFDEIINDFGVVRAWNSQFSL